MGEPPGWAADLQVSFTHDGGAHLALAAAAPRLRGLGVDLVQLDRLRGVRKDRDYLMRFARQFMGEAELEGFRLCAEGEDDEQVRVRLAAHFSLMEAGSKALGTGLRIGGGIGRLGGLPRRSICLHELASEVELHLEAGAIAAARCAGGSRIAGYWESDGQYLVSAALLW